MMRLAVLALASASSVWVPSSSVTATATVSSASDFFARHIDPLTIETNKRFANSTHPFSVIEVN